MSLRIKVLCLYIALLLASFLWQRMAQAPETAASLPASDAAPREWVALLPAAGHDASSFERLLAALEGTKRYRLIALDRTAASMDAEALERELLRSGVPFSEGGKGHLLGVGYGGAEALLLAAQLQERVASVTLVSSAVAPRVELLGDPRLNAALKALHLAGLWLLDHALPHFGALDGTPFAFSSARRVHGIDMERAGSLFETLETPMLVVGGDQGRLGRKGIFDIYQDVNPRAEVALYAGSGRAPLEGAVEPFARRLEQFWETSALARGEASGPGGGGRGFEEMPSIQLDPLFGGTLLALATFGSEDLACFGGGLLAASGSVSLGVAVLGCLLGIFIGDLAIYFIGRTLGASALDLPVLRRLASPEAVQRSARWFEKRGVALLVLTRFFPGSRVPTYFAAGVVKVGWVRFSAALLLACAIWTPILVYLSYALGESFLAYFEGIGAAGWVAVLAAVVCFTVVARLLVTLSTWRGRRLLYARWQRLVRWEFWPIWAVYAPVVLYIGWLALKYRSLTLPFSANPGMPASGLVYESKIQILESLEATGAPVARFAGIECDCPLEKKLARLDRFLEREGLGYPIVLKPDVGQRGQGVLIVESREQAAAYLKEQVEDTIAQEYVGGAEYGVLYHRFAGADRGVVSSITDKRLTSVVGDGASSLETLILRDERAVCLAPFFLRSFAEELASVPEKGQRFQLTRVGTHCRGALFLDAGHLASEALERAVDRFSKNVAGFHFGRYDLRVPSAEALRRGEGLRIIELNGITSEPTHMYDPKHSAIYGWKRLMDQWRLLFELGKENRLAGHEPVSLKYVSKLAWGHFRGVASRDLS